LQLFRQGELDAVWTVEPWVSRLEREAGGKIFLEQRDAVTTVLVSSVKLLKTRPALVEKFRAAHSELTAWIKENPEKAQALVRTGLSAEMKREMPAELVAAAWARLTFTDEIKQPQIESLVKDAQSVGFLRNAIPLDRLFSRKP
jgi:NitT/TauT family transport system substrate-binding protein